ncbi:MAG TPA: hypothetical protein VG872_01515 [Acidimicrobiia bacterium]|jgi:hypothetical protein|nr:hypothetical protein [Acidimicrobiia bacterium]
MKTHRFDALSFISGLVAAAIGLIFLIPAEPSGLFDAIGDLGSWFWPTLLILIGIAVIAPLAFGPRDGSEEPPAPDPAGAGNALESPQDDPEHR